MDSKKHRLKSGRKVINAAISIIAASLLALNATAVKVHAISENVYYGSFKEIEESSIVSITWEEYQKLLCMSMAEAGNCSYELINACAASSINLNEQYGEDTMGETLSVSGRYVYKFTDDEGEWREVLLSDVNSEVIAAVNDALTGVDESEERIGFFAPKYCSEDMLEYMLEHTSDYKMIEGVIFFKEWAN